MAERTHSPRLARPMRPETSAWLILVAFFGVFCALVATAGVIGWRSYVDAMRPMTAQARFYTSGGVVVQTKGSTNSVTPKTLCDGGDTSTSPRPGSPQFCFDVGEEYRVEAIPEVGYGPVASIIFNDHSQIDMWAHPTGSELMLKSYKTSRWTQGRQELVVQQSAGYARYDINNGAPYQQATYTVEITNGVRVELAPNGSYSINVPHLPSDPQVLAGAKARADANILVEVAVRGQGSATVINGATRETVLPAQLVQISKNGTISKPTLAQWNLIADSHFSAYQPNDYRDSTANWAISRTPLASGTTPAEENGTFSVAKQCPPTKVDYCTPNDQVTVGRFERAGQQTKPYLVGISQFIDADVSEYRSLRLEAWVRVITPTAQLSTTITNAECPLFIHLYYQEVTPGSGGEQQFCAYTARDTLTVSRDRQGDVIYQQVPAYNWYLIDLELRDSLLRDARYVDRIVIEARGHDYLSQIYNVSLVGAQ